MKSIFSSFLKECLPFSGKTTLLNIAEKSRGAFVNGPFGSDLLTKELQETGVPVIYIRDIKDGVYSRVSKVCVSGEKAHSLNVCSVVPGNILISKVGTPPGIAAIYPTGEPNAIVTQDVIRLRLNSTMALPDYIVAYLNSPLGKLKISTITIESTRVRFSLGDLKKLEIDLPPVSSQSKLSNRLCAVKGLIFSHQTSLAKLEELFASLQHRAFRGEL